MTAGHQAVNLHLVPSLAGDFRKLSRSITLGFQVCNFNCARGEGRFHRLTGRRIARMRRGRKRQRNQSDCKNMSHHSCGISDH